MFGVFLLHAAQHWRAYPSALFAHPLALLLYLHLGWMIITTAMSPGIVVSVKFMLAKIWYVAAFFWVPLLFLRGPQTLRRMMWVVFWPLLFVAVQSIIRHSAYGFSFVDQYKTLSPFMRNHVAYAGMLAVFTPWVIYLWWGLPKANGWRKLRWVVLLFWLLAVYLSYTRAAYLALLMAGVSYFVVLRSLMLPALLLTLAGAMGFGFYLLENNRFLEYAPNFETTVSFQRFDRLIEATYNLEDVSTMERVYRWVAGGQMISQRPWLGWGPGNFSHFYRGYTVNNFRTYVSVNEDNSGIHSYYLMTLVEQGWLGLLFLLLLLGGILYYGQGAYHRVVDPARRAALLAALLSMVVIYAISIINDLLETDKIGSFFFLNLAVLVVLAQWAEAE
ncbi:MAG: O-antigen ligase family protein [Lewinella sp.]|nr:O-antigen ligase family protein [Lewinella sp.]